MRKAFTLIELLIVIAILAVLAVVVVLALNPAALLQQSRDNNRISDMATLNSALGLYAADVTSGGSLGSANTVYVSIPDPTATSTAGDQCQGLGLPTLPSTYSYQCAASSTYRKANGTGWIPVNLGQTTFGTPLSILPIDPTNTSSSRLYYTYTTNGTQFEVTAVMEAAKYKLGGSADVVGPDGGTLATVYEKGSKLGLEPLDYGDTNLVGWWPLTETSGNTANDLSGKGNAGTINGGITLGQNGPRGSMAMLFDGTTGYVYATTTNIGVTGPTTIIVWFNTNTLSLPSSGFRMMFSDRSDGRDYLSITGDGSPNAFGSLDLNSTQATVNTGFGIQTSVWYQEALVWDGSSMRIYVNGTVQGSPTLGYSNPLTLGGAGVLIGAYTLSNVGTSWSWSGLLSSIRIYSRVLSASEIQAMYNGGK